MSDTIRKSLYFLLDSVHTALVLADAKDEQITRLERELAEAVRERDEALAELDSASPKQKCARCGEEFRWHLMVPEEGDEWECLPCNDRENERERALTAKVTP